MWRDVLLAVGIAPAAVLAWTATPTVAAALAQGTCALELHAVPTPAGPFWVLVRRPRGG